MVSFYTAVLGMEAAAFGGGRSALRFGQQKINLHEKGKGFEPKAGHSTAGSADLCFIAAIPLVDVMAHLSRLAVRRRIRSVYVRDPDGNLIEIAELAPRP